MAADADADGEDGSRSNLGRLTLLVGALLAAGGLAAVLAPGVSVRGLQIGWLHVTVAATVAVLGAVRSMRRRARNPVQEAETGTPESPFSVPTPGFDVDDLVAGFATPQSGTIHDRREVRERVEAAAVAVVARYGDVSEERARELVGSGDWTDDPEAAAFLDDTYAEPVVSARDQVRHAISPESKFQRRVRRAVIAMADRAGVAVGAVQIASNRAARDDRGDGNRAPAGPDRPVYPTNRWRGISAVGLGAIGLGVLFRQPAVLVAGVVGLGFAGYARTGTPTTVDLDVERRLSTETPAPGEEVRVTVTVRNEGDGLLPDLRLVDGVPDALAVVVGSPRLGVGLRPGKAATFSYTVVARQGTHRFGDLQVVARDLSGAVEQRVHVPCETEFVCLPVLRADVPVPLHARASGYAGRVATTTGGAGTEFHSTREYRHGDPIARIDWRRLARTGELSTVDFREEKHATVMLLVDARRAAYRAPGPGTTHTIDREVAAAAYLAASLLDGGNRIGLTAASPVECWFPPGVGKNHRAHLRQFLAETAALSAMPPEGTFSPLRWLRRLRRRLPDDAQVIFLSPLTDDTAALVARWLDGYGYPVTVVAPDPTDDRTTGQLLARIERTLRVAELRGRGVRIVDWGWNEHLHVALERADTRAP